VIKPVSVDEYPQIVNNYYLYQNYPNPFNPSTKIGYKLKERSYVKLMVYDIKGEMISVLVNSEQEAGYYEVEFSSQKSEVRSQLASGIYLYRIEVIGEGNIPVYSDMRKMVLIK
jgi:competence CoiA-like predicted nuclease